LKKENSESSKSEEEEVIDVSKMMSELQLHSMHMHESAFCNLWFGANPHEFYGATPTDLMHSFFMELSHT